MEITAREVSYGGSEEYLKVKRLLKEAFPPSEQLSMSRIYKRSKRENVQLLAFYLGEQFAGFTYLVHSSDCTFVFYLAIESELRCKGVGKLAMEYIKDISHKRLFLTIDLCDDDKLEDIELRRARKRFYESCGLARADFNVRSFGLKFEVMRIGEVDISDFRDVIKEVAGSFYYFFTRPKKLPLTKPSKK